jgi:hypothetical protein
MRLLSVSLTFSDVSIQRVVLRWRESVINRVRSKGVRAVSIESRDFFPTEDRRKVKCSLRVGRLGDVLGSLESLDIKESQELPVVR